jgi:hypothetical protein
MKSSIILLLLCLIALPVSAMQKQEEKNPKRKFDELDPTVTIKKNFSITTFKVPNKKNAEEKDPIVLEQIKSTHEKALAEKLKSIQQKLNTENKTPTQERKLTFH